MPKNCYKLPRLNIQMRFNAAGEQRMYLDEEDVSSRIRMPEISICASDVSTLPVVRSYLLDMQRRMAKNSNVIMDGRDIGTVVLPKATVKIFLTASPEVRAKRRYNEYLAKGQKANYATILKEIQQRDYQDTHREIAPLKMARDSIKVDTSEMTLDQVVSEIKRIISEKVSA